MTRARSTARATHAARAAGEPTRRELWAAGRLVALFGAAAGAAALTRVSTAFAVLTPLALVLAAVLLIGLLIGLARLDR